MALSDARGADGRSHETSRLALSPHAKPIPRFLLDGPVRFAKAFAQRDSQPLARREKPEKRTVGLSQLAVLGKVPCT